MVDRLIDDFTESRPEGEPGLLDTFRDEGIGAGLGALSQMVIPGGMYDPLAPQGPGQLLETLKEWSPYGSAKDAFAAFNPDSGLDPLERGLAGLEVLPWVAGGGAIAAVAIANRRLKRNAQMARVNQLRLERDSNISAMADPFDDVVETDLGVEDSFERSERELSFNWAAETAAQNPVYGVMDATSIGDIEAVIRAVGDARAGAIAERIAEAAVDMVTRVGEAPFLEGAADPVLEASRLLASYALGMRQAGIESWYYINADHALTLMSLGATADGRVGLHGTVRRLVWDRETVHATEQEGMYGGSEPVEFGEVIIGYNFPEQRRIVDAEGGVDPNSLGHALLESSMKGLEGHFARNLLLAYRSQGIDPIGAAAGADWAPGMQRLVTSVAGSRQLSQSIVGRMFRSVMPKNGWTRADLPLGLHRLVSALGLDPATSKPIFSSALEASGWAGELYHHAPPDIRSEIDLGNPALDRDARTIEWFSDPENAARYRPSAELAEGHTVSDKVASVVPDSGVDLVQDLQALQGFDLDEALASIEPIDPTAPGAFPAALGLADAGARPRLELPAEGSLNPVTGHVMPPNERVLSAERMVAAGMDPELAAQLADAYVSNAEAFTENARQAVSRAMGLVGALVGRDAFPASAWVRSRAADIQAARRGKSVSPGRPDAQGVFEDATLQMLEGGSQVDTGLAAIEQTAMSAIYPTPSNVMWQWEQNYDSLVVVPAVGQEGMNYVFARPTMWDSLPGLYPENPTAELSQMLPRRSRLVADPAARASRFSNSQRMSTRAPDPNTPVPYEMLPGQRAVFDFDHASVETAKAHLRELGVPEDAIFVTASEPNRYVGRVDAGMLLASSPDEWANPSSSPLSGDWVVVTSESAAGRLAKQHGLTPVEVSTPSGPAWLALGAPTDLGLSLSRDMGIDVMTPEGLASSDGLFYEGRGAAKKGILPEGSDGFSVGLADGSVYFASELSPEGIDFSDVVPTQVDPRVATIRVELGDGVSAAPWAESDAIWYAMQGLGAKSSTFFGAGRFVPPNTAPAYLYVMEGPGSTSVIRSRYDMGDFEHSRVKVHVPMAEAAMLSDAEIGRSDYVQHTRVITNDPTTVRVGPWSVNFDTAADADWYQETGEFPSTDAILDPQNGIIWVRDGAPDLFEGGAYFFIEEGNTVTTLDSPDLGGDHPMIQALEEVGLKVSSEPYRGRETSGVVQRKYQRIPGEYRWESKNAWSQAFGARVEGLDPKMPSLDWFPPEAMRGVEEFFGAVTGLLGWDGETNLAPYGVGVPDPIKRFLGKYGPLPMPSGGRPVMLIAEDTVRSVEGGRPVLAWQGDFGENMGVAIDVGYAIQQSAFPGYATSRTKFHTPGPMRSFAYTATHEMGHYLQRLQDSNLSRQDHANIAVQREAIDAITSHITDPSDFARRRAVVNSLSGYALRNPAEFGAELFARFVWDQNMDPRLVGLVEEMLRKAGMDW